MEKVSIHKLPVTRPPITQDGGRIITPAGELTQIINGQQFRHLVYLEFIPDPAKPRGNHYHREKTEHMYLITGRLHAVYQDVTTGETTELTLETGDLVTIEPNCAHVYYADEHTQAIEFSANPYNPKDTIPRQVEQPDKGN